MTTAIVRNEPTLDREYDPFSPYERSLLDTLDRKRRERADLMKRIHAIDIDICAIAANLNECEAHA